MELKTTAVIKSITFSTVNKRIGLEKEEEDKGTICNVTVCQRTGAREWKTTMDQYYDAEGQRVQSFMSRSFDTHVYDFSPRIRIDKE